MKEQAQTHLDGQSHHGEEKGHHDGILQQAHALEVLGIMPAEESVHGQAAQSEITTHDNRSEDALGPVRSDSENVRQVAIYFIDEAVMVPRLSRPEPLPAGSADKRSDKNHGDPQDNEAEEKSSDGKFALFPCVIAAAQRVGVYIRNH